MVRILPLSDNILQETISLRKTIFPYRPDQKQFKDNLSDSLRKAASGQTYWLAVDEANRIVGITGLYDDNTDKKVCWLGWFGVHPDHRRHGIGSLLLQYAIDEAVRKGATILKLYTSSDPNERAAHRLYKKFGFQQTGINLEEDNIYFMKILREGVMSEHEIIINWSGPYGLDEVISTMVDGGSKTNNWDGNDYGIYQIYGRHILYGNNALLYIGIATGQTFSQRFSQHKELWLAADQDEEDLAIYLGRVYDPLRHSEKDQWKSWVNDIELVEKILIYKYTPNYNSRELTSEPDLGQYTSIRLTHTGKANRLQPFDQAPKDFREW